MRSPQIDVSYFAAGIFAHLCCDGIKCWTFNLIGLNTILEELVSSISLLKLKNKIVEKKLKI
jgi:hypothetical protein